LEEFEMSLSRREFIAASAATAAGLAAAGRARAADEFGGFTVGIQSYTFRKFQPAEKALKRIQDAGVKYAEFYNEHLKPTATPEQVKDFKKLCSDFGIKPVAFGVEQFTKDHDKNKKLFEFGKELGIQALSADPAKDSFDSLDKLVEEYGIAIAIHPHGPSGRKGERHRWWSAEMIMEAVKNHNKKIGSCLDTGHLIRMEQLGVKLDPVQQIKVMGDRNFGLHLKDHDNKRKTDVPFGDPTGVLDVLGVLKALKEVKFAGYISIEYEANEQDPSADVKKCLAYFKEQVKKLG
jgi:sugar phosphate isomerase/epimerase